MLIPTQKSGKTRNGHSSWTHCKNGHEFNEVNTYISPKAKKRSCRVCRTAYVLARFNADPEGNREKQRLHVAEWRSNNREREHRNWTVLRRKKKDWLDGQKLACERCGESDPVCLDFHHRDPSQKDMDLSVAVAHWSISRLQKEMAKCLVICSNCHRKLHHAEREAAGKTEVAADLPVRNASVLVIEESNPCN